MQLDNATGPPVKLRTRRSPNVRSQVVPVKMQSPPRSQGCGPEGRSIQ